MTDLVFAIVSWDQVLEVVAKLGGRLLWNLLSIAIIVVVALVLMRLLGSVVTAVAERVLARQDEPPRELRQQAQTLASVIEQLGRLIIFLIAGMMMLASLGLEVGPLIASAGIAGVAIGLGAQSLIRDMINGFFIVFENQFGVGDVVQIGAESGTVEEVTLRRTVLRAVNGSVIVIPNSEVRVVINLSKGWSRAVIDVDTLPNVDDTKVLAVLGALLDDIQSDPKIGSVILSEPTILGITNVSPTALTFRVLVTTEPLQQWAVERELRARILAAFKAEDIPMPLLTGAVLAPAPPQGV